MQARPGGQRRGTSTDTAASTSSGTATGRRATAGRPAATIPSSTTAEDTAKSVAREAGTASPFQIPPRLARLASVPRPGSARAANASTPSRFAALWAVSEAPSADATNHGSAATSATPRAAAAHHRRGQGPAVPSPGAATQTSATVAANSSPVGVRPASAIQKASPKNEPDPARNVSMAVATQGRQP